jgi:eukaryotic-like serine/threonine-protein kinase
VIPAAGTCVVDERTGRVGKVMGNIGPNLQLRPLGGGREWECPPREVRRATRRNRGDRFPDGSAMAGALAPLVKAKPSEITIALVSDRKGDDDVMELPAISPEQRPFSGPIPATRREYARRLAGAALGGLVLALAAVFGVQGIRDDGAPPAAEPARYAVETTTVFDPSSPGEGDNADEAGLAADGNLQTSWSSDPYTDEAFGGDKEGIGLVFDLGEEREVRTVMIELLRGGLDVELYASNSLPPEQLGVGAWGDPRASQAEIRTSQPFNLSPTSQQYWLVWITGLVPDAAGDYTAEVAEVQFLGPS